MKVLKFGGSSISTAERVRNVIEIIKSVYQHEQIAVVVSAFGGVTDNLIEISSIAASGDNSYLELQNNLEEKHINMAKSIIGINLRPEILQTLNRKFEQLRNILQGVYLIKERSAKSLDLIMSFGERLSAFIISESLKAQKIDAEYLNASHVIKTDDNFGEARVLFEITNQQIQDYFNKNKSLQIVTGFTASTENNEITTLGRSGSDYTASILAAALLASEIEIWTDVNGVLTADPRKVSDAFPIERMTYEEAMEMSHFGSKVIHPKTMQPALEKRIPSRIRNSFHPEFYGTLICAQPSSNDFKIRGISSISNISLLRVQGSGMLGVTGISARLFGALAKKRINVILITQGSSEHSICFAVAPQTAMQAKKAIEKEFSLEIFAHQIEEVVIEKNLAIIAVVGENMRGIPGIAARIFHALGKTGSNVVAIAQGSSELNISIVIDRKDETRALNAIHEGFFNKHRKTLHLFLVGTGLVGSKLMQQVQNQIPYLDNEYDLEIKFNGIGNSKKMIFDINGLSQNNWHNILSQTTEPMHLADFVTRMQKFNFRNSIFVDCTASAAVVEHYERILGSGISIVTPNKKANSSSYDQYKKLKDIASKRGIKFLYETNVGAGLPIISTLKDLILSGDKILKIETIISGTISFIFTSFNGTKSFSEIVKEAQEKGYTEPDPRDDLNGQDVARKLLIIAREVGIPLEFTYISVKNILPESCQKASSVEAFFKELQKHDDYFEKLRCQVQKDDKVLRYIAKLENERAEVDLQVVDKKHPFYVLNGNENIIAITTQRYKETPMVIKGPGAGADVTAAGVFADIIRVGVS